jgi:hypothetical protein
MSDQVVWHPCYFSNLGRLQRGSGKISKRGCLGTSTFCRRGKCNTYSAHRRWRGGQRCGLRCSVLACSYNPMWVGPCGQCVSRCIRPSCNESMWLWMKKSVNAISLSLVASLLPQVSNSPLKFVSRSWSHARLYCRSKGILHNHNLLNITWIWTNKQPIKMRTRMQEFDPSRNDTIKLPFESLLIVGYRS